MPRYGKKTYILQWFVLEQTTGEAILDFTPTGDPALVLVGNQQDTVNMKTPDFLHGISINVNSKSPAEHEGVTYDNKNKQNSFKE